MNSRMVGIAAATALACLSACATVEAPQASFKSAEATREVRDLPPSVHAYAPLPGIEGRNPLTGMPFREQRASVETGCFGKELRQILSDLGRQFGEKPIVTSGHRKPGKRKGSLHISCEAADIQIPGVSPKRVAEAARRHPLVGGVGTYCHTRSVHVDVGDRRDWNWGCGGRKRKRA